VTDRETNDTLVDLQRFYFRTKNDLQRLLDETAKFRRELRELKRQVTAQYKRSRETK
jgi:hypothetical protein